MSKFIRLGCFALSLLTASMQAVAQQRDLTGAVAAWSRGKDGQRITVVCPPKRDYGKVFGTDVYTDDSSICAAAAHAGVISASEGGATTAVITGGKKSYRGSMRNGITSGDFAESGGSFTVERGDGGGIDWNTKAFGLEVLDRRPLAVVCPPGVSKHGVWGTDIYTDDTPICAAAAHAGLITSATGGRVVVEGAGVQPSFLGTSRNGIKSEAYGKWPRSFRFEGTATGAAAGGAGAAAGGAGAAATGAGAGAAGAGAAAGGAAAAGPVTASGASAGATPVVGPTISLPTAIEAAELHASRPPPGPAPQNVVVVGTPSTARVTWDPIPDAANYKVERWHETSPECCRRVTEVVTQPAWDDSGFLARGAYRFRVTARYADGRAGSTTVLFTLPTPVNPSTFTVSQVTEGQVKLTWNSVPDVSYYQLWGPGIPNTGMSVTGTSKIITGVPSGPGTWMIGSFYNPGAISNYASHFPKVSLFVTMPSACAKSSAQGGFVPQDLQVMHGGHNGAALHWGPAYQAVAYTVERAAFGSVAADKITDWKVLGSTCSGGSMIKLPPFPAGPLVPLEHFKFLDTVPGVAPGKQYAYRVKAFDATGKMGWTYRTWFAPDPGNVRFDRPPMITGSTVVLTAKTIGGRPPDLMSVSTSYGYSSPPEPIVLTPHPTEYKWKVPLSSVPVGTHTITVVARWTMSWDGVPDRVVGTRTGSQQITISQ